MKYNHERIAELVRAGKTTKEINELMHLKRGIVMWVVKKYSLQGLRKGNQVANLSSLHALKARCENCDKIIHRASSKAHIRRFCARDCEWKWKHKYHWVRFNTKV